MFYQNKAMKSRLPFRCFFTMLLLAVACPALPAQTTLGINTTRHCIYTDSMTGGQLFRFPQNGKVDSLIREIIELNHEEPPNFEWIQANVENVTAVLDDGKRYLLYSQDFLEKHSELEVYGILAHEIGHHIQQHTFEPVFRKTEELDADRFMGWVLSRKGFHRMDVVAFLEKMPLSYSVPYSRPVIDNDDPWSEKKSLLYSVPIAERMSAATEQFVNFTSAPSALPSFPWPPPACNTRSVLPKAVFKNRKVLGDVASKLSIALDAKGYAQQSFFSVPNGFALVTQLEQYNVKDGSVRKGNTRWLDYPAREPYSGLFDYLTSIVMPQKGYFRLFVFVVTDQPFGGTEPPVSMLEASAWLSEGFNKLPNLIAGMPFEAAYDVTALVYEFEVPESNRKPVQRCPSPRFSAKTHLQKAGIAAKLGF